MQNVEYLLMMLHTSDLILRSFAISIMFGVLAKNGSRVLRARGLTELLRNPHWKLYCCRTTCRSFSFCFSPHLQVIVAAHGDTLWTFCFLHVNFLVIISSKLGNKSHYVWDAYLEARDKKCYVFCGYYSTCFLLNRTTFAECNC